MNACRFGQSVAKQFPFSSRVGTLYMGGISGEISGVDVTMTDCHAEFGGNESVTGTSIVSDANLTCVGAAIGFSSSNTVQFATSLLLAGHIQFIGVRNDNVKRVIGKTSSSSVSGQGVVNVENLYLWKKVDANGANNRVTESY